MKIINACRGYITHTFGGMPIMCHHLNRELVKLGYDVHLITTGLNNKAHYQVIDGVHVHHLNCPSLEYSDQFNNEAIKMYQDIKPELWHSESASNWQIMQHIKVPKLMRTHGITYEAFVTSINNYMMGNFNNFPEQIAKDIKKIYEEKHIFHIFDCVVAINSHSYQILKYRYQHPNVIKIHNGIPPFPIQNKKEKFTIFYAGHLSPEKGYPVLLEASQKIKADIDIIVAGKGNPPDSHYKNIKYVGALPHELLLKNLSQSHIFCNPTMLCKGFDTTTLEGMAAKCALLVSRCENTDDVIVDGINGFSFIQGNSKDLAQKMDILSENKELVKKMAEQANTAYHENFTSEKMALKYDAIFKEAKKNFN